MRGMTYPLNVASGCERHRRLTQLGFGCEQFASNALN